MRLLWRVLVLAAALLRTDPLQEPQLLLGSLGSIFQVWIGYQAGYILQVRAI